MLLSPEEVKAITDRRLAASHADGCEVQITGADTVNLRFAKNSATSNGAHSDVTVTIASEFGRQSGSATATSLDEETLDKAQRRSEEIARRAPADPEHMPPLGPQHYAPGIAFDPATAAASPASRWRRRRAARSTKRGPRRSRRPALPKPARASGRSRPAPGCSPMTGRAMPI